MKDLVIREGACLKDRSLSKQLRILAIFDNMIAVCDMDTSHLVITYVSHEELQRKIQKGQVQVIEAEPKILDIEKLDERRKELFLQYKEICSEVFVEYKYRLHELKRKTQKPVVRAMLEEYQISRKSFWKVFTRYLQSGLSDYALLDQRLLRTKSKENRSKSSGRKTWNGGKAKLLDAADYRNFESFRKKYLSSEILTIQNAYRDMISEKYTSSFITTDESGRKAIQYELFPEEKRPTWNQFYYYVSTHTTKKQRDEAKKTARVVRNNDRVHIGTMMEGVRGPGHVVECDAQEMDISMVSQEYPDIPVGRPILYIMIDVMSEIILGVSLAMDNNSVVGLTNCFLNLVEDKGKLVKQYTDTEITFSEGMGMEDLWPTGYKPSIMRYDRGSDYISDDMERILRELNIRADYVTPGTGSMKPLVENFFGGIKRASDDLLEHHGLIRKTYGSKHHEEACLNYNDVFGIVINHVLAHNNHVITTYPKSAEMKQQKLMATPVNLWRFGRDNMREPKRFLSRDDTIFHVLLPCKDATISKYGIIRGGMPYFNAKDSELQEKMYLQGTKRAPFECRTDPRDMSHIYYLRDGVLYSASLPSEDFRYASYKNMSQKRYEELQKEEKEVRHAEREHNLQVSIDRRRKNRTIADRAAKENPGRKDARGLRDSRKAEKEQISGQNSVAERFDMHPEYAQSASIQVKQVDTIEVDLITSEDDQAVAELLPHYEEGDTTADLHRKMMEMSAEMDEF